MAPFLRWAFIGVVLLALSGCGFTKGVDLASKSVEVFHQQFNDAKYPEIYSGTGPKFKSASNEADFIKYIQGVRRKLGPFKSAKSNGWGVNATMVGTIVTLNFNSQFEKGTAAEKFTYIVSNGTATLEAYNIQSNVFVTD
jgi:hypothetical protein